MIEIKDVIHLYLGCQMMEYDEVFQLDMVTYDGFYAHGEFHQFGSLNDGAFKPILRPLSDMTEEESYEAWKIAGDHPHHRGVVNYISAFMNPGTDLDMGLVEWALVVKYFLSKHFDIFNLHEQGLCLYKSDLK